MCIRQQSYPERGGRVREWVSGAPLAVLASVNAVRTCPVSLLVCLAPLSVDPALLPACWKEVAVCNKTAGFY